jgi:hypothetical protein
MKQPGDVPVSIFTNGAPHKPLVSRELLRSEEGISHVSKTLYALNCTTEMQECLTDLRGIFIALSMNLNFSSSLLILSSS